MNILPRKPRICQHTQKVAPNTKINTPALLRGQTLLNTAHPGPLPSPGNCSSPSSNGQELPPPITAQSRGWPPVTEVNPVGILPWVFYNWIRDRKSLLEAESTKCEIQEPLVPCPVEEICQLRERIKPKRTEKSQQPTSTWFPLFWKPSPVPALLVWLPILTSSWQTTKTLWIF